jgi:hypothetical protein
MRAREQGLGRLQGVIRTRHGAGARPGSGRQRVHRPASARVHHGSTSVCTGGSTWRQGAPTKRLPCRDFATSCARTGPPFTRRCTTHNREVGGSNPPGAMPVVQRNAVSRGRRKMSSRSPSCRALVDTLLFRVESGNGLRAAPLINPLGSTTGPQQRPRAAKRGVRRPTAIRGPSQKLLHAAGLGYGESAKAA